MQQMQRKNTLQHLIFNCPQSTNLSKEMEQTINKIKLDLKETSKITEILKNDTDKQIL